VSNVVASKAALEARQAELTQRINAIEHDYAAGLSADSEERAQQLENAEVLAEISRVANEELAKVTKQLAHIAGLL
jgi:RNA polymerase-binding transcription factor DksA